ncbi:hypothetical protein D3C81_1893480 [compost metagenome]
MDLLGKERQGRRLADDHPDIEVVRHLFAETGEGVDDGLGLIEWVDDQAAQHLGADGMELELEAGDDPEVATTATQPPEQIGVLGFAGV